jgi:CubicO group peptidase (beta-lactamase class C family)
MTMNHLSDDLLPLELGAVTPYLRGHGFGFGLAVLANVAQSGTSGSEGTYWWGGSANTVFWVDPGVDLIGMMMLQFSPVGQYPFLPEFRELCYQAVLG